MVQIVEQSREERLRMYMKLSKKELAEMLINCNDLLTNALKPLQNCYPIEQGTYVINTCQHEMGWVQSGTSGFFQCRKCGYTDNHLTTYAATINSPHFS